MLRAERYLLTAVVTLMTTLSAHAAGSCPALLDRSIPGLLDVIAEAGCLCPHLEFDQYPQKHLFVVAQRGDGPSPGAPAPASAGAQAR